MIHTRRGLLMALPALAMAPRAFGQDQTAATPVADEADGTLLRSWFDPRNRPTASVTINGLGPFRFLVDTAATITVVGDAAAAALNLPVTGSVTVMGTTGDVETPVALIEELQTGAVRKRGLRAALFEGALGAACEGILGADVFAGRRLIFDMRRENVRVAATVAAPVTQRRSMRLRNGVVPELPGEVAGVPTRMIIDTGAECSIINMPLSQALLANRPGLARIPNARIVGLTGGELVGEGLVLPQVWFDSVKLRSVPALAADAPVFRVWDLDRQPAMIVGADLLSLAGRITIDYGSGIFDVSALSVPPAPAATYARADIREG